MEAEVGKQQFGTRFIRRYYPVAISVVVLLSVSVAGYLFWQENTRHELERVANQYHSESIRYSTLIGEQLLLNPILHPMQLPQVSPQANGKPYNAAALSGALHLINGYFAHVKRLQAQNATASSRSLAFEPVLDRAQRQLDTINRTLPPGGEGPDRFLPSPFPVLPSDDFYESIQQLRQMHLEDRNRIKNRLAASNRAGWIQSLTILCLALLLGWVVVNRISAKLRAVVRAQQGTESRLRLAAAVFENTKEGVVITDPSAKIVSVNKAFTDITGFRETEVLGKDPRMLQSGRHDRSFYQGMWTSLEETDQWQGEIWDRRKNGEVYPKWQSISAIRSEDGELIYYVSVFSDISSIKQSHEKLYYMAHHDPLTGLPNRLLLNARLEQAIQRANREDTHVAVLFMDLDRFKSVNDTLGHPAGDRLLQLVAQRLQDKVREEDTVARLGGDELSVVLEALQKPGNAAKVAREIIETLSRPFDLGGPEVFISASVGISIYPQDGLNAGTLLEHADAAMYQAKNQGRKRYQFYETELTEGALDSHTFEKQLLHALERDELVVHYQPLLSLGNDSITGVEAMVRWDHPEMGLLPPDKFISLAEENGAIAAIGRWVLWKACVQARAWQDRGLPPIRVAVNLSRRQLMSNNLLGDISRILRDTGLDPAYLELEISESSVMQQVDRVIPKLDGLKSLGVALTVDDFGTGFSSLCYLRRLPLDRLKIDRSLVRDIPSNRDNLALTRAIVALGHSLDMQVVAKGVETPEQRRFLAVLGCDEMQGFLYSAPIPADNFPDLLTTHDIEACVNN